MDALVAKEYFFYKFREGDRVLYVSLMDNEGNQSNVTNELKALGVCMGNMLMMLRNCFVLMPEWHIFVLYMLQSF